MNHQGISRIVNERGPGIRNQRQMFTLEHSFDQPLRGLVLVMGMKGHQGLVDPVVIQKLTAGPGVLTGNAIHRLEGLKGAKAQIPKIADGCCD